MCSIELDDAGNQFFELIKEAFERKFAVSVPIKCTWQLWMVLNFVYYFSHKFFKQIGNKNYK